MDHNQDPTIPSCRLAQPLPPLPFPQSPSLEEQPLIALKDSQESSIQYAQTSETLVEVAPPPGYTPMYDYLRSQQRQQPPLILRASNVPPICMEGIQMTYRDDPSPFIVQIDSAQAPPPSYNDLYTSREEQEEADMQRLIRVFDDNGSPAEQSEQVFIWVISMVMIALTVVAMGTVFNWGQPSCNWADRRYC